MANSPFDYAALLSRADRLGGNYLPKLPSYKTPVWASDSSQYPSLNSTKPVETPRRENQIYTGTLVKGIATMHKSNAVPVLGREDAIDIANMRRN